jgi:hypothetical protein
MFIEATDVHGTVLLFRIDDINSIEKVEQKLFKIDIEGIDQSFDIDDRGYQKIRNKFKEKGLLL